MESQSAHSAQCVERTGSDEKFTAIQHEWNFRVESW